MSEQAQALHDLMVEIDADFAREADVAHEFYLLLDAYDVLRERSERYEQALRQYADPKNWLPDYEYTDGMLLEWDGPPPAPDQDNRACFTPGPLWAEWALGDAKRESLATLETPEGD